MSGDWIPVLVERLTTGPHHVLGAGDELRAPGLRIGELATCVLFDPAASWTVGEDSTHSLSRNTPLWGARLHGRVLLTIAGGLIAHHDAALLPWPSQLVEATNG
jgi:dihydroorotase